MKKVSAVVFSLAVGTGLARAADLPNVPAPRVLWSWTGLYLGGHAGGGFGTTRFSDPAGPSIYGGGVRSPAVRGGAQLGYNWQLPNSRWVLGVEADASALRADGTATCLASSGMFVSANCRVRQDAFGSVTGRVGFAAGSGGHVLIYAKGGGAWLHEQIDVTTAAAYPAISTGFDGTRWGWTVGAGVEKALTPAWSLSLEYDYANFGSLGVATPAGFLLSPSNTYVPTAAGTAGVSQDVHTVKMGLNLKLGEDLHAQWAPLDTDFHLRGTSDAYVPETEIEVGGRVWYSSGRFQKDLGATADQSQQNLLVSRLTYDTTSASGELFGRIDTSSNLFLKGFVGGGKQLSGKMNDEDWGLVNNNGINVPYSNTLSDPVTGDLSYATADFGYALFRGPSSKVGGFIGFNYFNEAKSAYGCAQIANANSDCVPAVPNSTLGITENNKWYSLRLGLNGVVALTPKLTLTADAAYLPLVAFRGTDNHLQRTDLSNTVSPETGSGQGVQLEAIMAYSLGHNFSLGAGGRYWAMWAPGAYTNIFGTPCPCQTLPARTERYGAFVQASYKLDGMIR